MNTSKLNKQYIRTTITCSVVMFSQILHEGMTTLLPDFKENAAPDTCSASSDSARVSLSNFELSVAFVCFFGFLKSLGFTVWCIRKKKGLFNLKGSAGKSFFFFNEDQ